MQRRPKRVGPYCRSQFSTLFLVLSGCYTKMMEPSELITPADKYQCNICFCMYLFLFSFTGAASAVVNGESKVAPTIVDGKQISKSEEARAAKLLKSPKKMINISKPKKSPSKIRKNTAAGSPTKKKETSKTQSNNNNNTTNENNNITNDSNEISSNSNTADPSTNTADPSTNTADPSINTADPSTNTADPSTNTADPSANTENTENISEATPLSTNTSDVESEIKPEN